jgi:hypothetical protein
VCACAQAPCRCGFHLPTRESLLHSLGQDLVCLVDQARDVRVELGLRPYVVRMVRTRWTGGARGRGQEVVTSVQPILPVPKVSDLTALTEVLTSVGVSEQGGVMVTEISGAYTEDQLLGKQPGGVLPERDEKFYWEVEYVGPGGGELRRFTVRGAPTYLAEKFQWTVQLERADQGRSRAGEPR